MIPSRFFRNSGYCSLVLLMGALAACSDVGDNTGLGGGQDGAADGTVEGGGDTGPSSEAAADATGGEDAGQSSETGGGGDGSEDALADSPVADTGEGNQDGGADSGATPDAGADSTAQETGAPDAQPDGTVDAGSDSGTHLDAGPDASHDASTDGSGSSLVPCTASGQTGCVKCQETSGVCTPTEAVLVQMDIDNGKVTVPGPAPADPGDGTVCYSCMAANFCLDNPSQTGFECGDLAGNFTNGAGASVVASTACLNTLKCISGTSGMNCPNNANGISDCYCGPSLTSTQCITSTAQNGPCLALEIAGFAYTPGSTAASTILGEFTTQTQPSGNANSLAACAVSNGCNACIKH